MTAVGVVIPVRDGERWLGEALDSLALQRPASTEVVVVDDGSTDASAELARTRGFRVVASRGHGPNVARNTGVALLATPLVAFLDADDRLTAAHHRELTAALAHANVARGRVRQFAADAEAARRYAVPAGDARGGVPGGFMLRRELFDAMGGFDEDPQLYGEFELLSRLAQSGERVADVEAVVLERRIHGQNLTLRERDAIHARYLASARAAIERRRA